MALANAGTCCACQNSLQDEVERTRGESKTQQEVINRLQREQLTEVRVALGEMTAAGRSVRKKGVQADESADAITHLQGVLERCSQELQVRGSTKLTVTQHDGPHHLGL